MTSDFDPKGREQYAAKMRAAGYQELKAFAGYESYNNFCCLNCAYFKVNPTTATGYWCEEIGFPDRRHGCCDAFRVLKG